MISDGPAIRVPGVGLAVRIASTVFKSLKINQSGFRKAVKAYLPPVDPEVAVD